MQAGAGSTTTGRLVPEGVSVKKIFSEQTAGQDSHLAPLFDRMRWKMIPNHNVSVFLSSLNDKQT